MNKPVTVRDVREIDMGSHAVIEASAGTGKTYTIESLFVRALLESSPDRLRPLKIDEILAVTFTEKATGELKERIRSKINGLLHKKDTPGSDKELLKSAIENFDSANIFTIHGFCKTILRSYAFENGEPFIMQVEDDGVLYSRMLKDQMRKLWKGWFGEDLATLLEISGFSEDSSWLDDTASMASMYRPECGERILPELSGKPREDLSLLLGRLDQEIEGLTKLVGKIDRKDPAGSSLNMAYGSLCAQERRLGPRREKTILPLLSLLSGYLYGPGLDIVSFSRLISSRDKEAKKFEYLIDADMKESLIAERLPELPRIVESLERLRLLNLELSALLRATAVRQLKDDVALYKRERGVMSYEDMLNFVDRALRDKSPLVEALRKRYACAFVDEFQDTDSVQWRIFRNIFLCETNKLFIIGDPKQSIYGFRGADIDAYLEAKREMILDHDSNYYSLATNWRSSPPLIDAFNRLFGEGGWFPEEDISYAPVSEPSRDMRKAIVYRDGTKRAAITAVDMNLRPRGESFHRAMAGFMAYEIKRLLDMGAGGLMISKEGLPTPVTASDICILIKGRGRSKLIERFLREAGVPHSFYKKAGLYNSEEALHISYILDAVEDPSRDIAFKKALMTPFFAVSPSEIYSYDNLGPSHKLKILFERWYGYAKRRQWPVLFRSVIEDTGIYYDKDVTERRISNYRQILEGLEREAMVRNLDIVDIISTLRRYRRQDSFDDETFDVERLETEEPRVRIMTIHAAKGLEFPVVFLADGFSDAPNTAPYWKYHGPDNKVVYDLLKTDDGKARLRREEVRDNRELFYVALTRAKYKLYIPKFSEEPYAKGPLSYIVGAAINNAWGGGLPDSRMLRFVDTRGAETVSDPPLAVCEDRLKGMPKKTTHKIRPVLPKPLFPDISVNFAGRKIDVESYSSIKEDMVEPGHLDDIREGSWITYYDESGYAKREDDRVSGGDIHEDVVSSPGRKDMAIPPGSSAGTMLHEILEEIDFGSVGKSSSADDLLKDEEISRIIAKKLKRFGFPRDPRDEAVCIREAARMIWNTLNTTLADPGRSLSSLVASDKITELEFYYPMPKPGDIGSPKKKICRDGFITGYIDLVFRMGGRYYILDWKSNYLEEGYSAHAINENMASSGYDLQYKVYSVAVLKWLRSSIERFDYERDFGGIYYIYMRGMDPARPGEGYIHIRPESERKINLYEKEIFRLVSEKARS